MKFFLNLRKENVNLLYIMILINTILTGILATLVCGITSYVMGRRSTFINIVAKSRLDFLSELRKEGYLFCSYLSSNENDKVYEESLTQCYFHLKMMFYPLKETNCIDKEICHLIDSLYKKKLSNKLELNDSDLLDFVALMQANLNLEWHGFSKEGEHGILSTNKKNSLRNQYYDEYKKYKNKGLHVNASKNGVPAEK